MTGRKEKDVVERCSHGDMIECGHAMWSGDEVEPYNRARRSSDAVELQASWRTERSIAKVLNAHSSNRRRFSHAISMRHA